MIHELATNATKYGALSNASGRVEIEWKIHRTGSDEQFLLTWSEIDGPPSKVPDDLGFGSVILTSVVGSELKCKPTLGYQENGFQYNLDCSLSALTNSSQTSR